MDILRVEAANAPFHPDLDGSDAAVVGYYKGQPFALDYFHERRALCNYDDGADEGACPDAQGSSASNNVGLVAASRTDGVTSITIRRPWAAFDTVYDLPIAPDGSQYFIWAVGRQEAHASQIRIGQPYPESLTATEVVPSDATASCGSPLVGGRALGPTWTGGHVRASSRAVRGAARLR